MKPLGFENVLAQAGKSAKPALHFCRDSGILTEWKDLSAWIMVMDEFRITSLQQLIDLWTQIYPRDGKPDWSQILPYYDREICFRDSIQEIQGIEKFTAMTKRLTRRSRQLEFIIHNSVMSAGRVFLEWEMVISYKKFPKSSLFGSSRLTLRDGKIIKQRDYYDLWGDIFDNIPFIRKVYRRFMQRYFG